MNARAVTFVLSIWLLTWIAPSGAAASRTTEDVLISSSSITLSGNLHFPETSPKAGLVLIHGSARKDSVRMTALAQLLADAGFAVLTYDKRGIGKSGGSFPDTDDKRAHLRRIVVTDDFDDHGRRGLIQNGWSWYAGI